MRLVFLLLAAATAGDEVRPPLQSRGRALRAGDVHALRVKLEPGQALMGQALQRGIDVVVHLVGPDGGPLLEVDSPNGTAGPEPIALVAQAAGVHTIEVRAFEAGAESGLYDLVLEPLRAATARDRAVAESLRLHVDATRLRTQALELQSRTDGARANALYAEAHGKATRALALRRPHSGPADIAASHQLLGLIDDEIGAYVTGKAHFAEALRLLEQELGADAPATLTTRSDLGYLALANGDWDEAATLFGDVLRRREAAHGPEHPSLNNAIVGYGQALRRRGDLAASEEVLRRGIRIRTRLAGADHPSMAWLWLMLADTLVDAKRLDEAESLCARTRDVSAAHPASSRLHLASALACLGRIRLARGDADGAVPLLREALRLREAAGGPDHPWTAQALADLGRALVAGGQAVEARTVLARAAAIAAKSLRPGHPLAAEIEALRAG